MRPTPNALRERVVAARHEDHQTLGQIARRFRLPKGTVQNILEHHRDTGTVEPKPRQAGRKPAFSEADRARLTADVRRHPDATLEELRDRSGLAVSLVCVHRTLRRLGFTRKKSRYVRASRTART